MSWNLHPSLPLLSPPSHPSLSPPLLADLVFVFLTSAPEPAAPRSRSASSRQLPASTTRTAPSTSSRKARGAAPKVTTTARGDGRQAGKGKDIIVIDEEEDGEDAAMPEEYEGGQDGEFRASTTGGWMDQKGEEERKLKTRERGPC